jgi:hypothetical protein
MEKNEDGRVREKKKKKGGENRMLNLAGVAVT